MTRLSRIIGQLSASTTRLFLQSIKDNCSDPAFSRLLIENAHKRGENLDIQRLSVLVNEPTPEGSVDPEILNFALRLPNWTHPDVPIGNESDYAIVRTHKSPLQLGSIESPVAAEKLALSYNWLRYADLGLPFGPKTYVYSGPLSELESALVRYALSKVEARGFHTIHVPELVNSSFINGCGFPTDSHRSQVYKLGSSCNKSEQLCLIGTAEMALAGFLAERCFLEKQMPLKLCAVSRCFRAEASDNQVDKGLYRVHQFYKVEMFVVSKNDTLLSNRLQEELVSIEEEICREMGLSYRVLDIPSKDLGLPAYRKFDIEAWLPGHNRFGELTSASNCIDWQSSRLGIRYKTEKGSTIFAHTLNGTALAVPRVIIALLETHQHKDYVAIPEPLVPFFGSSKMHGLPRCWRSSPAQNISGLLDSP